LTEDEKENNADSVEVINYFKRKRQDDLDHQSGRWSDTDIEKDRDYGF